MLTSFPKKGKNAVADSADQALMREVIWPGHPVKRLSRALRLPIETAKHWCDTKVSSYRRREWALGMLRVMDRQDIERQAAREYLEAIAGYANGQVGMLDTVRIAVAGFVGNAATGVETAARKLAEKASE